MAHNSNGGKQAQGHAHYSAPRGDRLGEGMDEPGTWASDAMKANWYTVIHDFIPTNERLHTSRLSLPSARIAGNGTPPCTD